MSSRQGRQVLTIPNALTILRALGIPLFLWLYLSRHNASMSFIVLAAGALTDYLDGKVARALNQESELGAALDPAIDRAYIASTVIALAIRSTIPWWIVWVLATRDLWMLIVLAIKKKRTGSVFEVTYLGKSATFNLLYAFPLLLLSGDRGIGHLFHILGWAFIMWGIALYLFTAVQYSSLALIDSAKGA